MTTLSLEQANRIVAAALAAARQAGLKPMAVAVVDEAGHLKAMQREDGATAFRADVALAKAWSAFSMGVAGSVLGKRAADNPVFFTSLAATGQGRFLAQAGSVLIKDTEGTVLGAIGASGDLGDKDEAICAAGVRTAGLCCE